MKKVILIAALAFGMNASAQTNVSVQSDFNNTYGFDLIAKQNNLLIGFGAGHNSKENFSFGYYSIGKEVSKSLSYAVKGGFQLKDEQELKVSLYCAATAYLNITDKINLSLTRDNKSRNFIGLGYKF